MQVMNNNEMDKEEEKGGLTLEQFTDIVLAQVIFDIRVIFDTISQTKWDKKKEKKQKIWLAKLRAKKERNKLASLGYASPKLCPLNHWLNYWQG